MSADFERARKNLSGQTLPFNQIPNQTRLFLDYLKDPTRLKEFYPEAVESLDELPGRVPKVLKNYTTDREALTNSLAAMNSRWGASQKTLDNIDKLREADCLAVVTGQQAGLLTGALYTVYKAFSTIKVAERLSRQGVKAVPVFWIASEDHDFAEVAATEILDDNKKLKKIEIAANQQNENLQVGRILLSESVEAAIEDLFANLPQTQFSADLHRLVRDAYKPEYSWSESFARLMTTIFGEFGLILLDPLDENLKKLASPILAKAVEKAGEVRQAMISRSRRLLAAGYHAQVLIKEDSFPLFWNDDAGKRCPLHQAKDGKIVTKCTKHRFETKDLIKIATDDPARLSANATLRATVQDFLLPTLVYFGGAAEIAYFAQSSEVYRILERPVTPIFHRASVTLIEPDERAALAKYNLSFPDFLVKHDEWFPQIVEKFLNPETSKVFAQTENVINIQLDRLNTDLNLVDPTLVKSLERRRSIITKHHLDVLKTKFYHAEIKRNNEVRRQLETVCTALYPHKGLQERTLNITYWLAKYDRNLLAEINQLIDIETSDHQIFYL